MNIRDIFITLRYKISYGSTVEWYNFWYIVLRKKRKITPQVASIDETIRKIIDDRCSVSRFGDGEVLLTSPEKEIRFQKGDPLLAKRLTEVLQSHEEGHIVCISDAFRDLYRYNRKSRRFWRTHFYLYGSWWDRLLVAGRKYYNTFVTRPYMDFARKEDSARWFHDMKGIWDNRDIVFIEGGAGLICRLRSLKERKRVVVVCPNDPHTEYVITRSLHEGFADFLLVADTPHLLNSEYIRLQYPDHVKVYEATSPDKAAQEAVSLIREGHADVLMKGIINTDNLLRAVLNKEHGILPKGNVLSHITVAQIPMYKKLLFFSDAAVIPRPTLEQFEAMLRYDLEVCRRMGIEAPRVALIHCTEKVNEKFPHTLDYVTLKERAAAGAYGNMYLDGPMDVKTACDAHSGEVKGISSPVVGHADLLIFPNIESGNTFYKTVSLFGDANMAGMLRGTASPVVVPSRADSGNSKYYSLALACVAG